MQDLYDKIDTLKKELDSLSPMDKADHDRLWEKFRLEWNYNSNHIEGNTMTYGDTKLLLRLGDDFRAQNNTLKEVNEMRAHDVAIYLIRDWANGGARELREKDIRELNQIILVKDYWSEAQTSEGNPTRRLIKVGEYKDQPNHVRLPSGEVFRYAEPFEVPLKMKELVDWYNATKDEHPLVLAAFLHYKFVCIHPFDDGNGRVSRLLMNYHLMKNNFPPLIIKSEDKKKYLYALNQADVGNTDAFVRYLGEQLLWSLEIAIKAAKGESIQEQGDLDKEIEVWKKEMKSKQLGTLKRSNRIVMQMFDKGIYSLIKTTLIKIEIFRELFTLLYSECKYGTLSGKNTGEFDLKIQSYYRDLEGDDLDLLIFNVYLVGPTTKVENKNLRIELKIEIIFNPFEYTIFYGSQSSKISRSYHAPLTSEIIDNISEKFKETLFKKVKEITS
jgi:Fic family protein